jgi:hypothetical protein
MTPFLIGYLEPGRNSTRVPDKEREKDGENDSRDSHEENDDSHYYSEFRNESSRDGARRIVSGEKESEED